MGFGGSATSTWCSFSLMILFSCSPPWLVQRLSWSTAMFKTRVWLKIWKLNCSLVRFPVFGISYLFWKESWILKLLKQLILSAFPLIALHMFCKHTLLSPSFEPHLEAELLSPTLPLFLLGTSPVDFGSGVYWEGTMLSVQPQAGWDSYPVYPTDQTGYLQFGNC